jgi:hypothetical protein
MLEFLADKVFDLFKRHEGGLTWRSGFGSIIRPGTRNDRQCTRPGYR